MAQDPERPVATTAPAPPSTFGLPQDVVPVAPAEQPALDIAIAHSRGMVRIRIARTKPLTSYFALLAGLCATAAFTLTDFRLILTGAGPMTADAAMTGLNPQQMAVMAGLTVALAGFGWLGLWQNSRQVAQDRARTMATASDLALPPTDRDMKVKAELAAIKEEIGGAGAQRPGKP